jgi:hypothetical protein
MSRNLFVIIDVPKFTEFLVCSSIKRVKGKGHHYSLNYKNLTFDISTVLKARQNYLGSKPEIPDASIWPHSIQNMMGPYGSIMANMLEYKPVIGHRMLQEESTSLYFHTKDLSTILAVYEPRNCTIHSGYVESKQNMLNYGVNMKKNRFCNLRTIMC